MLRASTTIFFSSFERVLKRENGLVVHRDLTGANLAGELDDVSSMFLRLRSDDFAASLEDLRQSKSDGLDGVKDDHPCCTDRLRPLRYTTDISC